MLTIFQQVRFGIHSNQLAKHCVTKSKSNLKLYDSSCFVNGNNYYNQFATYIAQARLTSSTKLKKLSPVDHLQDRHKETGVVGHSFSTCACSSRVSSSFVISRELNQTLGMNSPSEDTEISTCDWPSDKMSIAFPQGDKGVSKQGLIKYNNGFSNIKQKQSIRSIYTQTKLAQQKQAKEDEHFDPPPQNSPPQSDFANYSTDQLTRRQKLKRAMKEYGSTVLVFHITISLTSLVAFYVAVSSGIDMASIMSYLGIGDKIQQSQLAAGASTFVVAYAIHKVFAPLRIGITLSATPLIVRYLRLKGILKPPKQL